MRFTSVCVVLALTLPWSATSVNKKYPTVIVVSDDTNTDAPSVAVASGNCRHRCGRIYQPLCVSFDALPRTLPNKCEFQNIVRCAKQQQQRNDEEAPVVQFLYNGVCRDTTSSDDDTTRQPNTKKNIVRTQKPKTKKKWRIMPRSLIQNTPRVIQTIYRRI